MSIEGQSITVRCKGSLRVNGVIAADLHCAELVVGEQAVVNGSIAADSVRVFGQVNGAILGANVVLHPSAQVEGDIHSQSLTIEQGASFDGRSRKVNNPAEVAPQLECPARTSRLRLRAQPRQGSNAKPPQAASRLALIRSQAMLICRMRSSRSTRSSASRA